MPEPNADTASELTLEDMLREAKVFPEDRALNAVLSLSRCVATLHTAGKLHRSVVSQVTFESDGARLGPPPGVVTLGGAFSDLTVCPPELQDAPPLSLPGEIDPARVELRKNGFSFDPRRIDIYQLGVVLCQAVTGQSIDHYLKSPKVKGSLSPQVREIIDRALGFDIAASYTSAELLAAAIEAYADAGAQKEDTDALSTHGEYDTDAGTPATGHRGGLGKSPTNKPTPFRSLGHYEILERIGHGGMGDVYKAYERSLDRMVAIKVLPPDFARHPEFLERFQAEAAAIASISHPNVIQIYFIGEDAGHHYFAMQYVDGGSLADALHSQSRFNVDEAIAIVEQVLAGLSAVHLVGIVHRDVKPGNILIDGKTGRTVVADFGLVKSIAGSGKLTATGVIMGTVDYISPEQARGHAVDARSDLYSVGALAYHLLTGTLPFEANTPTAMIFQHVYEEPPSILCDHPDIPKPLAAVVHRLLAKSPDDRFQSAAATIVALRAALTAGSENVGPAGFEVARKRTAIISAPQFLERAPLPHNIDREAPLSWWVQKRKQLRDGLRRRAPEFVKQLQNTQQQVDGALADYEDRRNRLQSLVDEADEVLGELRSQVVGTREAARDVALRLREAPNETQARLLREEQASHENSAAELEHQVCEQEQELETMRLRLAQVNATLSKLRSQRDLLDARLKVARVRAGLEVHKPKRSLGKRIAWLAVISAAMTTIVLLFTTFMPPRVIFSTSSDSVSPTELPPQGIRGEFGETVMTIPGEPNVVAIGDRDIIIGQQSGEVSMVRFYSDGRIDWDNQVATGLDPVRRTAMIPGRRMFAVASGASIQLWDAVGPTNRRESRLLKGHSTTVTDIVFSPDGTLLLSGSQDGTLIAWDVARAEEVNRSNTSMWIESLAWSKDRSRVLIGARVSGADSMSLWSYFDERSERLFDTHKDRTYAVAFSSREDQAYSLSHGSIQVRDLASGDTLREFGAQIVCAAFAPEAQRAWTADRSGAVTVWDTRDGSILRSFPAHATPVQSVAISRDGLQAVSISADGELRLWRLPAAPPPKDQVSLVTTQFPIGASAAFMDAKRAIADAKGDLVLWDLGDNRKLLAYQLKSRVTSVALSMTGDRMIYGTAAENGTAIVGLRHTSNQLLRDEIQFKDHTADVSAVAIAADQQHAASGGKDGVVHVLDVLTGQSLARIEIVASVNSVAFVRSGMDLFIASDDGAVRRWNWKEAATPEAWVGHTAAVRSLAVSSDGARVASASDDGTVIVWNANSGEKLATLTCDEGLLSAVDLSMHGLAALVGGANGAVQLWDVAAESKVQQFTGHSGRISSVEFSLDGLKAVSCSDDKTIRVWKLPLLVQ